MEITLGITNDEKNVAMNLFKVETDQELIQQLINIGVAEFRKITVIEAAKSLNTRANRYKEIENGLSYLYLGTGSEKGAEALIENMCDVDDTDIDFGYSIPKNPMAQSRRKVDTPPAPAKSPLNKSVLKKIETEGEE